MQGRSWMAALTLTLMPALIVGTARAESSADGPSAVPAPPAHTVQIDLRVAGLLNGGKGCDVEIKPGHAGCKFKAITQHVAPDGIAKVVIKDVVTRSADRDASFSITIRESGQAERTVLRGLRLPVAPGPTAQLLPCYLSSPSRIARNQSEAAARKR
jgi:hypothetical protein